MNQDENSSVNTMHILSQRTASLSGNGLTGALIVNGGTSIYGNMIVNDDILTKNIDVTGNLKVRHNMYINGNIIFGKDLMPSINIKTNRKNNIGHENKRWENAYMNNIDALKIQATNLDILNDISLGSNNESPVFKIDEQLPDTCVINGNLIIVDNSENSVIAYNQELNNLFIKTNHFDINGLFTVNKNLKHVIINGVMMSNTIQINNYLQISPQTVIIDDKLEDIGKITIESSLVFVVIEKTCKINIDVPVGEIFNNIVFKIVVKENKNDDILHIRISEKTYELREYSDYIELFASGDTIDIIGKN